jgi:hypothetical protein
MLRQRISHLSQTALLLGLLPIALASAHGDDHGASMNMGGMGEMSSHSAPAASQSAEPIPPSYFRHAEHSGWIYGHIIVMTLTWTVILPLGKYFLEMFAELFRLLTRLAATVFSVANSRFALVSQVVFFLSNTVGLILGTVYNANTPDLYENNAHHKMGWVFTWFAGAWIVLGVLNLYAGRYVKSQRSSGQQMSIANLTRYSRLQRVEQASASPDRRWSGDSGQGTERNSDSLFGTGSPGTEPEHGAFEDQIPLYNTNDFDDDQGESEKRGFLQNTKLDRFLSKNIHHLSSSVLITSEVIYILFERLLVVLGFAALLTGIVTFGGLFVSHKIRPK